mgnify:CR=1 FL=1
MTYFCGECKHPCKAKVFDYGIGPYEFWGQRCVDTRESLVSDCCEASVYTDEECTQSFTLEDEKDYRDAL